MLKYELSKYDFEALDKLMSNVLGYPNQKIMTASELAVLDQLKDKFAAGHTAYIEIEDN